MVKYFKISLKDTCFHNSINSLELYLFPECLLNFFSNLYILPWSGKTFKFIVFTILEDKLNLGIFTHAPLSSQYSNPNSYHHTTSPRRGRLLILPIQRFFKNPFHQKVKRGEGNYDLLLENSTKKFENDLEYYIIYTLYNLYFFFKCDGLTVL